VEVAKLIPPLDFFTQQVFPPNVCSGPQGFNVCLFVVGEVACCW